MLHCSTSLWSADLTRLADDLKRVEPHSEKFHLDVADGHYVPNLLFFPDLVRQLRPFTSKPFEVHLMVTQPEEWIEPFIEAGADIIIICHDSSPDPLKMLQNIRSHGAKAGVSLQIHEPIDLLAPLWEHLDVLCVIGTAMGIKGASMDSGIPAKIEQARRIIDQQGYSTEIEADGGIRRETVPLLKQAGADTIVPGSLMFKEDPPTMRKWLQGL
jgi:ribulose-phosphate 3-epimerase